MIIIFSFWCIVLRIVILATEPSGDFLGSELIKELKKKKKKKIWSGWRINGICGMNSWVKNKFNAIGLYK